VYGDKSNLKVDELSPQTVIHHLVPLIMPVHTRRDAAPDCTSFRFSTEKCMQRRTQPDPTSEQVKAFLAKDHAWMAFMLSMSVAWRRFALAALFILGGAAANQWL